MFRARAESPHANPSPATTLERPLSRPWRFCFALRLPAISLISAAECRGRSWKHFRWSRDGGRVREGGSTETYRCTRARKKIRGRVTKQGPFRQACSLLLRRARLHLQGAITFYYEAFVSGADPASSSTAAVAPWLRTFGSKRTKKNTRERRRTYIRFSGAMSVTYGQGPSLFTGARALSRAPLFIATTADRLPRRPFCVGVLPVSLSGPALPPGMEEEKGKLAVVAYFGEPPDGIWPD